ncbi:endonuclease III [Candidatus Pacearchaeota archaeon CG10_big_fil_rev_8_21_14_0_10_32_14]|nr:MAG: endonuclease III [Candidatus Pacearchaeota archaeon CG10_big_fil_rev_8_21_14_0_10_32_14]
MKTQTAISSSVKKSKLVNSVTPRVGGRGDGGGITSLRQKKSINQLRALNKYSPKEMRLAADWPKKWQALISTILSAQTKDETTIRISEILYKKYSSPQKLSKAKIEEIEKIIRPINYHKTKARHIKETAKMISRNSGRIPQTLDELLKFPGVGRKVGNVYLAEAHKFDVIGVDTHVARISQKLGWTKNKHPHKIEKDLEVLFPKKYWRKINDTCVRFGRSHGRSKREEDEILKEIMRKI